MNNLKSCEPHSTGVRSVRFKITFLIIKTYMKPDAQQKGAFPSVCNLYVSQPYLPTRCSKLAPLQLQLVMVIAAKTCHLKDIHSDWFSFYQLWSITHLFPYLF